MKRKIFLIVLLAIIMLGSLFFVANDKLYIKAIGYFVIIVSFGMMTKIIKSRKK